MKFILTVKYVHSSGVVNIGRIGTRDEYKQAGRRGNGKIGNLCW